MKYYSNSTEKFPDITDRIINRNWKKKKQLPFRRLSVGQNSDKQTYALENNRLIQRIFFSVLIFALLLFIVLCTCMTCVCV